MSDPFGGDSTTFTVTSPINPSQLQDEIVAKVGVQVQVALCVEELEHVPSPERPATLYVNPEAVDTDLVTDVIAVHVPREPEVIVDDVNDLIERVQAGATLTLTEVSAVLRAVVDQM